MKQILFTLVAGILFIVPRFVTAQDSGGGSDLTINLKGDGNTEQAAKLELIRILQERLNKLTVTQLNSRIIVSRGVADYYKVDEIVKMGQQIWAYRSKYVTVANKIEAGNSGFSAHAGSGFTYKYITELNGAVEKADIIKKQLQTVIRSGKPVIMPAMPSFSISPSSSDPGADMAAQMNALMGSYGVTSQADFDALSEEKRTELKSKMDEVANQFKEAMNQAIKAGNKQNLKLIGNIVGTAFGVPGAGNLVSGLLSGDAGAAAGLVGSIVDNFQIPTDYYDSNTLKLTDAERIKVIDELHLRMSDLYQQVSALGASLSTETKSRYSEISAPRNEGIMYGPKK